MNGWIRGSDAELKEGKSKLAVDPGCARRRFRSTVLLSLLGKQSVDEVK